MHYHLRPIFKVHELLRRENAMAYEPEILAIGPYHRGKERLEAMEVWKLRGLKSILDLQKEKDETKYVEAMKRLEGRARECYSESIFFGNGDEFAEMLLLDGCFIIQFLLTVMKCHKHNSLMIDNHCFFRMDWVVNSLYRDMLLLENQIPLFVLQELFYFTDLSMDDTDFHDIAQDFAGKAFNSFTDIPIPPKTKSLSNDNDVEHLLGLLHRIFCPPVNPEDSRRSSSADDNATCKLRTNSIIRLLAKRLSCGMFLDDDQRGFKIIPSATKLHDAGVTFKKVAGGNPFEVFTFDDGVMEIPIFDDGVTGI